MLEKIKKIEIDFRHIFFGAIVILLALEILPKFAVPASVHRAADRFVMEDRPRQTWAGVLAGVFFLFTAYSTWRTVKASELNLKLTQRSVEIAQRNLEIAQKNAENSRRLELYKIAFPEKFTIAQKMYSMATLLVKEGNALLRTIGQDDEISALEKQIREFDDYLREYGWLFHAGLLIGLGDLVNTLDDAKSAMRAYSAHIKQHPYNLEEPNEKFAKTRSDFESSFANIRGLIAEAMRNELHTELLQID